MLSLRDISNIMCVLYFYFWDCCLTLFSVTFWSESTSILLLMASSPRHLNYVHEHQITFLVNDWIINQTVFPHQITRGFPSFHPVTSFISLINVYLRQTKSCVYYHLHLPVPFLPQSFNSSSKNPHLPAFSFCTVLNSHFFPISSWPLRWLPGQSFFSLSFFFNEQLLILLILFFCNSLHKSFNLITLFSIF